MSTSQKHQCPQCSQSFQYSSFLQRHLETHLISGDWLCGLCNILFNRFSALTLHWRTACLELKDVFCNEELKAMTNEEMQEAAFRYTLDRYSMNEQGKAVENCEHFTPDRSSICHFCNLYVPRSCFVHHLKTHTHRRGVAQEIPETPISHICDLCGFGFRFRKSLLNHWRTKCQEIQAHISSSAENLGDQEMIQIVQELIQQAEVYVPESIIEFSGEEDLSRKPSFSTFQPGSEAERKVWNVDREQPPITCPKCHKRFFSQGRLLQHMESFHSNHEKPRFPCDLCQMKFKQSRSVKTHLRKSCRAFRAEVPDENKRKTMNITAISQVVENTKEKWTKVFEKKKAANLNFIMEFLADLEAKKHTRKVDPNILLQPPMPRIDSDGMKASTSTSTSNTCRICKVTFHNSRFLQRHLHTAHQNHRNLPTVSPADAIFYDLNGKEYKLGKYLIKNNGLEKDFKEKIVKPGGKWLENDEKEKKNDFVIVEIQGDQDDDIAHVMLNETEFGEVCDEQGHLKELFKENPKRFDDLPVLQCEV